MRLSSTQSPDETSVAKFLFLSSTTFWTLTPSTCFLIFFPPTSARITYLFEPDNIVQFLTGPTCVEIPEVEKDEECGFESRDRIGCEEPEEGFVTGVVCED